MNKSMIDDQVKDTNQKQDLMKNETKNDTDIVSITANDGLQKMDSKPDIIDQTVNQDLIEGKGRIVPATDKQKQEHNKIISNDKIGTNQVELKTVIANSVIATLQNVSLTTPLKSSALSSFIFTSVDDGPGSAYGITPYVIAVGIPQLFKFTTLYNETQQVNLPDLLTMKFSTQGINDTVSQSINIFNISTMTVRIELNDNLGSTPILDPNNLQNGSLTLQTVERSGRVNPQSSANFVENRIFSVISAFLGLDNVLIAMPKKQICLDSVRGGPVAEALITMPFYEGQHPHPYYSVYSNLPDWARQHFNECFEINPLQIGDMAVDSYGGMKLSQKNKLVIDQWTAAVLNINFDKLRNHTLTTNTLQEKIRASLFKYDSLEVLQLCDLEDFTLLYNYTQDEYNLYLFRLLTDKTMQLQVINFLNQELEKTNRLTTVPLEDVWKGILAGDVNAASFNQTWLSSINIGNSQTPVQMLVYETFSDFFIFNLSFSAIPSSLEAIGEILSIIAFAILYPKVTQRIIHQLGFRLTQLLDAMYPRIYNLYRSEFGDVRTNFGKDKFDSYGYQISRSESQQGYVYSIFTPTPKVKTGNDRQSVGSAQSLLNKLITILNTVRRLMMPTTFKYNLDRKRIAKYPYLFDDYTAYASWTPIDYNDYYTNQQTELGNKLRELIGLSDDLKELFTSQNPDSSQIPRGFNSYFASWTNQLARMVSTAGNVFQMTCAMMQETLVNSPFFVGSRYTPDPAKFFYVQEDIGIGPLVSASLSSLVIPTHIVVSNFRVNVGMCLALTAEGEYLRNTLTPYEEETDVQQSKTRIRNDITALDGVACFKMLNKLVSESRKFGFGMQILQWLTTPDDIENPFGPLVSEISQYMKMASWVPLARKIFDTFGLNFENSFIRSMGASSFILDGRYLDRTLVLVDATNSMAKRNQPLNSKFGMKFTYMVPLDIAKLTILTKPLLSMDSKIIYIHKDWYVGKMIVDELGPTQTNLSVTNWTDETTINKHFSFLRVAYKNGQAAQIEYKSDITGLQKSLILPYTAKNAPILLIKMEYAKEIKLTYLRVIAKAISQGKILLRITNMKMRVSIEDMPSRTQDYSDPNMSEDDIYDVISQPAGCIMEHKFKTTQYASNFASEALVCPGYIQWFATPHPADRNIFASTITNAILKPQQTILPTSDEMGYGPDEEGMFFPNNIRKIDSNIVNWNNSIPTVSPKLVNSIDLKIIPYIPQYLGTS